MSSPYNPENSHQRADGQPVVYPSPGWNQPPASPNFPPYGDKPPRDKMPWYGKGCLGIVAGFFALVALAIVFGDTAAEPEPQPDPPAATQEAEPTPEPEPSPEPSITVETTEPDNDDVIAEAGGDEAFRTYNESFDDPAGRGDEAGFLNHMLAEDREIYVTTANDTMLDISRTVCEAFDSGYTVVEVLDMFPPSLTENTQASLVSGSVGFICTEHFDSVQQQVEDYQAANGNV